MTVHVVGEQVFFNLDTESAEKLVSLIGQTASGTFGDFYDDLLDAGLRPRLYHTKTYGDLYIGAIYLEKR